MFWAWSAARGRERGSDALPARAVRDVGRLAIGKADNEAETAVESGCVRGQGEEVDSDTASRLGERTPREAFRCARKRTGYSTTNMAGGLPPYAETAGGRTRVTDDNFSFSCDRENLTTFAAHLQDPHTQSRTSGACVDKSNSPIKTHRRGFEEERSVPDTPSRDALSSHFQADPGRRAESLKIKSRIEKSSMWSDSETDPEAPVSTLLYDPPNPLHASQYQRGRQLHRHTQGPAKGGIDVPRRDHPIRSEETMGFDTKRGAFRGKGEPSDAHFYTPPPTPKRAGPKLPPLDLRLSSPVFKKWSDDDVPDPTLSPVSPCKPFLAFKTEDELRNRADWSPTYDRETGQGSGSTSKKEKRAVPDEIRQLIAEAALADATSAGIGTSNSSDGSECTSTETSATSSAHRSDDDDGDWFILDAPQSRHSLRYPDPGPFLAMPEAKNGATALDDPRVPKPITRVIKNRLTGSHRPPKGLPPGLTESIVRWDNSRDVAAGRRILASVRSYWGDFVERTVGEGWMERASLDVEALVEVMGLAKRILANSIEPRE